MTPILGFLEIKKLNDPVFKDHVFRVFCSYTKDGRQHHDVLFGCKDFQNRRSAMFEIETAFSEKAYKFDREKMTIDARLLLKKTS